MSAMERQPEYPRVLGQAREHYSEIGRIIEITRAEAAPGGVSQHYDPFSDDVIDFFRNKIVDATRHTARPIPLEVLNGEAYTDEVRVQIAQANSPKVSPRQF